MCYSALLSAEAVPEVGARLGVPKAFESSFIKITFPCGTCSWRYILDGCLGAGVEMGRGQSGYLHMYPFLLPLRDAGATGFAGVLCPRGNTPLLQQGEPDTHRQHQESHRGTSEGNGGRKENREQSYRSCLQEYPATCPHRHPGVLPQRGKAGWGQSNNQGLA